MNQKIRYGITLLFIAGTFCGLLVPPFFPHRLGEIVATQAFGLLATGGALWLNHLRGNPERSFSLPGYSDLGDLEPAERNQLFRIYLAVATVFTVVPFMIALRNYLNN